MQANSGISPILLTSVSLVILIGCVVGIASLIFFCATKRKGWLLTVGVSFVACILAFSTLVGVMIKKRLGTPNATESLTGAVTDDGSLLMFPAADWGQPDVVKNSAATFSRGNILNDQSCWVVTREKDGTTSLQQELDTFIDNASRRNATKQTPPVSLTIDRYPALQCECDATVDGTHISYLVTILETPSRFHCLFMSSKTSLKRMAMPKFREVASKTKVLKP